MKLTNLVDLHQHLGSSSTGHFLWELANEQGIRLPEKDYWKFRKLITVKEGSSFKKYLKIFDLTELIQSSPSAVSKSAHNAVSYSYRKSNIDLIEIRFNPMLRNKGGEHDLDKIIFNATVGIKKAMLEYPIKAGLILMMDRRFTQKQNNIIIEKAIRFKSDGIIGIDIAGPNNNNFAFSQLKSGINKAKQNGLGVTIHTGEATPVEEVWEVVKMLQPDRIGHGIRSVDDPKLLNYLSKKNIVLELCPTSNIRVNLIKNWENMRDIIIAFKKHKVKFTINSDNPELLHTNVQKELTLLFDKGILSKEDIKEVIKTARESTFIS